MQRLNVQTHPELAALSLPTQHLRWTRHATEQAVAKRLALRPQDLRITAGMVVEAELQAGTVSKLVVRWHMTPETDAVLVLVPTGPASNECTVVTCWTNTRQDTHRSLRLERLGDVC
jgi:hypothetical protein